MWITFVVTKKADRGRPDSRIAMPSSDSVLYSSAPSRWVIPASLLGVAYRCELRRAIWEELRWCLR